MSNYPTLRLGVLQSIASLKAACDAEDGFLRKPDCPYDIDTIKLLEELFRGKTVEVIKEVVVAERKGVGRPKEGKLSDDDAEEVEGEARGLLAELNKMGLTAEGDMKEFDTKTKLDIIKVKTSLLEKLVSIRERFSNVRKVSAFQNTVISILDDLVAEDSRDEFMKRLEPYRS